MSGRLCGGEARYLTLQMQSVFCFVCSNLLTALTDNFAAVTGRLH